MTEKPNHGLRTWIEIDRNAVKHNFGVFRSLISKSKNPPAAQRGGLVKLMAVVKSNAYGHGLIDFSREMEKLGADFLGVDSITEALALRKNGIKSPILILGYTMKEMLHLAAEHDIAVTVSNFETLRYIEKFGAKFSKPLKIHVKVDTGMHRQGFLAEDLPKILGKLKVESGKWKVEGLYTHFASAKNPAFPQDTRAQIAEFRFWVAEFKKAGLNPIAHAAATSGTMLFPESHFDMVRVGIGLYGLWPAREVKAALGGKITLKPALTWKTIIGEIKKIPAAGRVGYDFTETVSKGAAIAVCPIGYWHGYPRSLSSVGRVLVKGQMSKVLGRVSMDMIAIDVTGIPKLSVEDEVILIGKKGVAEVSAEDVAYLADASWYEIIARLNPFIKRIYI